jgi:hypothetical protein
MCKFFSITCRCVTLYLLLERDVKTGTYLLFLHIIARPVKILVPEINHLFNSCGKVMAKCSQLWAHPSFYLTSIWEVFCFRIPKKWKLLDGRSMLNGVCGKAFPVAFQEGVDGILWHTGPSPSVPGPQGNSEGKKHL